MAEFVRVRCVRPFRWLGEAVAVGQELDVGARDAHHLVHGYGYCVPVDEPPASGRDGPAMVVSDPPIRHADPVVPQQRGKRR